MTTTGYANDTGREPKYLHTFKNEEQARNNEYLGLYTDEDGVEFDLWAHYVPGRGHVDGEKTVVGPNATLVAQWSDESEDGTRHDVTIANHPNFLTTGVYLNDRALNEAWGRWIAKHGDESIKKMFARGHW